MKNSIKIAAVLLIGIILSSCSFFSGGVVDIKAKSSKDFVFGIWSSPPASLLTTQEDTDIQYERLADAGINMVIDGNYGDPELLERILSSCKKYGISYIPLFSPETTGQINAKPWLDLIEKTKDNPCVIGYMMVDEPGSDRFEELAKLREQGEALLPAEKFLYVNLFPAYASNSQLTGPGDFEASYDPYGDYLTGYMETVKPKVLSFDNYPFYSDSMKDKTALYEYMYNMSLIKAAADKNGVPFWGFLQSVSWSTYLREPTDGELRFLLNTHIAFGAKGVSHFLYYWDGAAYADLNTPAMLGPDGAVTEIYERARRIGGELRSYDKAFMQYDCSGVMVHNNNLGYADGIQADMKLESFGPVKNIECDGDLLIGCFEKGDKKALFVVNLDFSEPTEATVYINGTRKFEVWGADGLEQSGKGASGHFALRAGEAKFLAYGD